MMCRGCGARVMPVDDEGYLHVLPTLDDNHAAWI